MNKPLKMIGKMLNSLACGIIAFCIYKLFILSFITGLVSLTLLIQNLADRGKDISGVLYALSWYCYFFFVGVFSICMYVMQKYLIEPYRRKKYESSDIRKSK